MNAFYQHHQDNIRLQYRCFDRLLLNGLIQPFQQAEWVVGFFHAYRQLYPISRDRLRQISSHYHQWVQQRSQQWKAPILPAPQGGRDEFVEPYFRRAKPDQIRVIVKAREPARILTSIGKDNRWHLELKQRWVEQYNFYIQDAHWGRMFVRVCPYFPFSARVCLNQHQCLALRLKEQGIRFRQCGNAFLSCGDPQALQKLADSLTAQQLAVMHALVRFAHVAASNTFATPEIYSHVREALGLAPSQYKLSSLRYDLWKLRAKGLAEKVPHSHRYRLPAVGYRLCLVYLKLFEKIYAPLTAGLLAPFRGDRSLPAARIAQLDRLYQRVVTALDQLVEAVGLKAA